VVDLFRRLRAPAIAVVALALSASLALGAQSPGGWGQAAHRPAGTNVGLTGDDQAGETVETTETDTTETETTETDTTETDTSETDTSETDTSDSSESSDGTESGDAGTNCTTDPTAVTPEELAAMSHGSIVCWAAQQTTWPAEFANHGAFVSSWAHSGKDAASTNTAGKGAGAASKGKGKSHHGG
jgi:hypothetical protein